MEVSILIGIVAALIIGYFIVKLSSDSAKVLDEINNLPEEEVKKEAPEPVKVEAAPEVAKPNPVKPKPAAIKAPKPVSKAPAAKAPAVKAPAPAAKNTRSKKK